MAGRTREAERVAEYAEFGRRAGEAMAEHEVHRGHELARRDDAVRMMATQNVLGADAVLRDTYVDSFAEGYRARWWLFDHGYRDRFVD